VAPREHIILAIDAGGSNTRCLLASAHGSVLGFGTGGPGNHILCGWEVAQASFKEATAQALRAAGTAAVVVDVAVAGSAGVGAKGEGRELVEWLLRDLVPQSTAVQAAGDMVTGFWGALRVPIGVVVTAGTGSVAFGRNARGTICQVGGWGPIMGDEGSAYDIATCGLRAMARATDGRGTPTALDTLLPAALGADTAIDAALRVYTEPVGREDIAALAVEVAAAATAGDRVATEILRRAGEELGLLAVTVLRTLALADEPVSVSFAGSVFQAGRLVYEPFVASLNARAPLARVEPPLLSPLGGAFRMGLEALGITHDDTVIERLRAELPRNGK
jgi:N-acetylglucosamine kinase